MHALGCRKTAIDIHIHEFTEARQPCFWRENGGGGGWGCRQSLTLIFLENDIFYLKTCWKEDLGSPYISTPNSIMLKTNNFTSCTLFLLEVCSFHVTPMASFFAPYFRLLGIDIFCIGNLFHVLNS